MDFLFRKFLNDLLKEKKENCDDADSNDYDKPIKNLTDREIENYFLSHEKKCDDLSDPIRHDEKYLKENLDKYIPDSPKDSYERWDGRNRRRKKRVKTPSATLDLHGKKIGEAIIRLASFVEISRRKGCLNVLIVVGKGIHSKDGKPVLKEAVESWLSGEGSSYVSWYKGAERRYGGSGSIWVKLKRKNN